MTDGADTLPPGLPGGRARRPGRDDRRRPAPAGRPPPTPRAGRRPGEEAAGPVRGRQDGGRPGGPPEGTAADVPRPCSTDCPRRPARRRSRRPGGSRPTTTRSTSCVYESLPGYFVSALLYLPKKRDGAVPGVLSPCGHSAVGKADPTYQTLHINLAKRGYVVLTYDPVGQGERSQFWDAEKGRSRFNLTCGEHAVLGNPLYLLGTSLARYRIWDGMRGHRLPGLAARGRSEADRLRRQLRRRHPDRVHRGPRPAGPGGRHLLLHHDAAAADGQPHPDRPGRRPGAGHLRLRQRGDRPRRPARPAGAAADAAGHARSAISSPSRGPARSFAEAKRLYEVAGAARPHRQGRGGRAARPDRCRCGRRSTSGSTAGWPAGRTPRRRRRSRSTPRPAKELRVCADGQVNLTFRSRPLLPLAAGRVPHAAARSRPRVALQGPARPGPRAGRLPPDRDRRGRQAGRSRTVVCVNGNEAARVADREPAFVRGARQARGRGHGGRPARRRASCGRPGWR